MNNEHELELVLDKLAAVPIDQHRGEIELCLRAAYELNSHGEWGIALEEICNYLYEYDFPLTKEIFNDIQRLIDQWGIEPDYIKIIKKLLT